MPNRLIKSSIHESEKVNEMTDFQFRVWVNLITYVDDYGRGDARPQIIKGNCFPLRERMTTKDIEAALNALAGIGCINLYEVDGRPYLCFPNWESHQNIRNKTSRFPAPDSNCKQLNSIDINCKQLQANVPVIQSESESKKESESEVVRSRFPDFWQAYPKKVAKLEAERAWHRLNPSDELVDRILDNIERRKGTSEWTKGGQKFIPHPATYLSGRRWEDELPDESVGAMEREILREWEEGAI